MELGGSSFALYALGLVLTIHGLLLAESQLQGNNILQTWPMLDRTNTPKHPLPTPLFLGDIQNKPPLLQTPLPLCPPPPLPPSPPLNPPPSLQLDPTPPPEHLPPLLEKCRPSNRPRSQKPPTHRPPIHRPPTHRPPTHRPPTYQRPTHSPPTHSPPTHSPPTHPPPPLTKKEAKIGIMVGLFFAGFAGFFQVGIVVFLVLKRKQLLKMRDGY